MGFNKWVPFGPHKSFGQAIGIRLSELVHDSRDVAFPDVLCVVVEKKDP